MGNPNNRRTTPSKPAAPTSKPTNQPTPSAPSPPCTADCGVRNRHPENAAWNPSDKNLPAIVKTKQITLNEDLASRNFARARSVRAWLENFYTHHNSSAIRSLPPIPPLYPLCKDKSCPVRKYHPYKFFQQGDGDLPSTVGINIKSMEDALANGDLDRAGRCCGFLRAFWDVHGGEWDEMGEMPRMP
ncbi:MAG: hypothetical protein Q9204_004285 [Flavoplaca sp. TL-2023a]